MVKEVRKPMPIHINKESRLAIEKRLEDRKIHLPKLMDAMANRMLHLGWTSKYAREDYADLERAGENKKSLIYGTDSRIYNGIDELGKEHGVKRSGLMKRELYAIVMSSDDILKKNLKDLKKYAKSYDNNYPIYIGITYDFHRSLRGADLNGVMELVARYHIEGRIDLRKYLFNDEVTRAEVKTSTGINSKEMCKVKVARANRMLDYISNREFMTTKDLMFAVLEYIRVNPIVIGEYHTELKKLKKPIKIGLGKDVLTVLNHLIKKGEIKDYNEYLIDAFNSITMDDLEKELEDKVANRDTIKKNVEMHVLTHDGQLNLKTIEDIVSMKEARKLSWTSVIDSIVKLKYIKDKKKER